MILDQSTRVISQFLPSTSAKLMSLDHLARFILFLCYIQVNITTYINAIFDQKFKDNCFIFPSSSFVSANRNIDDDTVTSELQ